jgi:hypothetical protein
VAQLLNPLKKTNLDSIDHIPHDEQVHFVQCAVCGNYFDCRNLSEVFEHEHINADLTVNGAVD